MWCYRGIIAVLCLALLAGPAFTQPRRKPVILFWCKSPEELSNATFITPQVWIKADSVNAKSLKRRPDYEQSAWLKKGIKPLRWMGYPKEKSEDELVAYWASAFEKGYVGIAIDEIGHVNTDTDAKVANALTKLKRTLPNLSIAVWHAGRLTEELLRGYREGADLVLLETYGVPFEMSRYQSWIEERVATVRKAGIIHKTVIAIGINDASSPEEWRKVGQWVNTPSALKQLLNFIRKKAPEMPGVAFFAPHASDEMLKAADKLAGEIFGSPAPLHEIIADYDAELRRPDGRVDIDLMVARLRELGVNTYFWLIWHAPTDWDDLQLFLPKAADAGIKVWVYLVPPSESPPYTKLYSEPFRLDYFRWAEEIAKLSLKHPNLTAWVIDDFYANAKFFTPEYVREMQRRAKAINPNLAFLPLMYFPEITRKFVNDYRQVIDGVVVAYPQDADDIEKAWTILNDVCTAVPCDLSYPWGTPSSAGDFVTVWQKAKVLPNGKHILKFSERDDFNGPTAGYHFKQLLIDSTVVWEEDVAGGKRQWQQVVVDVSELVRDKEEVTVAFRLIDKRGVSNFGVRWELKDLKAEGFELLATLDEPEKWQVERRGAFEAGFGENLKGQGLFHIPFIAMTAAQPYEFRLRHGDPATPERIAQWLEMCLKAFRAGKCDGVVTYCLDKSVSSQTFPLAQRLFREFAVRW